MGKSMEIRNPELLLDGMARDGREFGHVTENLRDALLNGAKNVEFGIHGLEDQTKICVARRYIADDGTGMSRDTLISAYTNFGETGTDHDFDVTLDTDGSAVVNIVKVDTLDSMHKRRGIGGRASLSAWNPLGVVTVTIHEGVPLTTWMFRTIEGKVQMREWSEDGKRAMIVEPYVEPEYFTYDDIMVDKPFSRALLVRAGMVENVDEADVLIDELDEDDVVPNPFHGVDWSDVLPKWIVASWDEDGTTRRKDGSLAHGTIKILLGETPTSSTAITGDPSFPNEAVPTKYNGAINASWLDLSAWNVTSWTMVGESRIKDKSKHVWYEVEGHTEKFKLDGGSPRKTEKPSGRAQLGALKQRTKPGNVDLVEVMDLGKYGTALVIVAKLKPSRKDPDELVLGSTIDASRRDGMVAVVYGNELHGLGDADKLQPEDYQYRNLGVPTSNAFHKRVSIILFPPRATSTEEGVFQAYARDNIKWSGMDKLPMGGDDGINATVTNKLPEGVRTLARVDGDNNEDYVVDQKRYEHIKDLLKPRPKGGTDASTAPRTDETTLKALEADASGESTGTNPTEGGTPVPRDPCSECGLKIHAEGCSLKPKTSTPGGRGGRAPGTRIRLTADEKGKLTGRRSRAKVKAPAPTPEAIYLKPPRIEFVETPIETDDPRWPVSWDKGQLAPKTGTINVYRYHAAIDALFQVAETKAKRWDQDVEKFTRKWIGRALSDGLMGTLALAEMKLDTKAKGDTSKFDLDELTEQMVKREWWMVPVASLLANQDSLLSYVRSNAAAAPRKTKAA